MKYLFFGLYLLDVALHMYACAPPEKHGLRRASKCFLMPLLLCWYYFFAPEPSAAVMLALFCGFLGDIFLIGPDKSWLFVSGLISFAVGHICYIVALLHEINTFPPVWIVVLACVCYIGGMASMLVTLWPRLPKNMFIPCLSYMGVISAMSLCALAFALDRRTAYAWAAFAGSLLFLISDSVLSFVTFKRRIPYRYVIVMSTYITAQTLLTVSLAVLGGT